MSMTVLCALWYSFFVGRFALALWRVGVMAPLPMVSSYQIHVAVDGGIFSLLATAGRLAFALVGVWLVLVARVSTSLAVAVLMDPWCLAWLGCLMLGTAAYEAP